MYHKHNTEGFVISCFPRLEANNGVVLFTKEFGLLYASVQSSRASSSKLRYNIQDFTFGNFSLVKGKHSWKLVGAESKDNIFFSLKERENSKNLQILLANIFSLIRKISGEESNEKLYKIFYEFVSFISKKTTDNLMSDLKEVEFLTVLRILESLGFVRGGSSFESFFDSPFITKEEIEIVRQNKAEILNMINESLEVSTSA